MMNKVDVSHIAHQWFEAFNHHDLERLLDLYHEDASHYSPKLKVRRPETGGFIKGKQSLRVWWADSFERLKTLRYELMRLTPFENRVFMEYRRHVAGEEVMIIGEMLEVTGDKISSSSVYHQ